LDELGFQPTALLPYVLDPGLYRKTPSLVVKRLFPADRANVLVVGRVAPNKRIEDILGCFAVYQQNLERRSRLLVVGETRGAERYVHSLMGLSRRLGLRDAYFAGQVTQEELLAYYAVADVLLSLSEHEGFGVPLVEGMMLGVPVVAFEAGAVAETLGGSGVLLKDKSPGVVAAVLDALRCNSMLRAGVVARQRRVAERILAVDPGASLLEILDPLLA
jgi:glycosyltransferase involved in cell wall biosynthesis